MGRTCPLLRRDSSRSADEGVGTNAIHLRPGQFSGFLFMCSRVRVIRW